MRSTCARIDASILSLLEKEPLRYEPLQEKWTILPAHQSSPELDRTQNCTHCSALPTHRKHRPGPDEEHSREPNQAEVPKAASFEARQRRQTHERVGTTGWPEFGAQNRAQKPTPKTRRKLRQESLTT